MVDTLKIIQAGESNFESNDKTIHFVLEDQIADIDPEEVNIRFGDFATSSFNSRTDIPLYRLIWTNLAIRTQGYDIVILTLIAEKIAKCVDDYGVERIVCEGVDDEIEAIAYDIATEKNLKTNLSSPNILLNRVTLVATSIIGVIPFIIDQIFSIVLRPLWSSPTDSNVVFVPSVGRFDSMRPVLEAADFSFDVLISPMTIGWLRPGSNFSDINKFSPSTFNMFATPRAIISEMKIIISLIDEFIFSRTLEKQLCKHIHSITGLQLDTTVSLSYESTITTATFRNVLYYPLALNAIDRINPDTIVVGSLAPFGKTIMAAGYERNVNIYHLPHSITTAKITEPPFNATSFVSGEIAQRHIKKQGHIKDSSKFVVSGRPYLDELYDSMAQYREKRASGHISVMLATQPFDSDRNSKWINDVIDATSDIRSEIVIKTHPIESTSFYEEQFSEIGNLKVVDSNLYNHLQNADMVITVNSNVGLEGIISGATCVCVNYWEPQVSSFPYAVESPVPILRSPDETKKFFENICIKEINRMWENQFEFLQKNYVLQNTSRNILDQLDHNNGE